MPPARRAALRSQPTSVANKAASKPDIPTVGSEDVDGLSHQSSISLPKHVRVPNVPLDSDLFFELITFLCSLVALGLQYIHLYKTVWWLPFSTSTYSLNFYLIDPHLALFIAIICSRRFVGTFLLEPYWSKSRQCCVFWFFGIIKGAVLGCVATLLVFAIYQIVLTYPLLYCLFLCYPFAVYFVVFGPNCRPLVSKHVPLVCPVADDPGSKGGSGGSEKSTPKHRASPPARSEPHHLQQHQFVQDVPMHSCSLCPETVREETDILKTDFNNRLKQILFNSMMIAYFCAFLPLCFAQNTLYYDGWWAGQHVVLVGLSGFVQFSCQYLPVAYQNVLHRSSLHLGHWHKVEGRNAHVPYNAWSELQVWPQGTLVKHVKGLFKAEGINNSAEPGNSMHARFYFLFSPPLRVTNWLLVLLWVLVGYQLFILLQSSDWSHVVSLSLLLFTNFFSLYKLMRDRFVLARTYKHSS